VTFYTFFEREAIANRASPARIKLTPKNPWSDNCSFKRKTPSSAAVSGSARERVTAEETGT
jgi:hypothetical protein